MTILPVSPARKGIYEDKSRNLNGTTNLQKVAVGGGGTHLFGLVKLHVEVPHVRVLPVGANWAWP